MNMINKATGNDLTIGSKQATIDTKKLNTVWNSTERKKEKKKINNEKNWKKIKYKHASNSQEKIAQQRIYIRRSQDDVSDGIMKAKARMKEDLKYQTRNVGETEGQTIQDLSTISPWNQKKKYY